MNTHDIELPPLPTSFVLGYTQGTIEDIENYARAAIEADRKHRGEVVVTKTPEGEIIAVTRQDDEGKILSVIAEADRKRSYIPMEIDLLMRTIRVLENIERDKNSTICVGGLLKDIRSYLSASQQPDDRKYRGEPVAYRLLRKNADGEWVTDGRPWCDGVPDAELVKDSENSGQYRMEYAVAAPQLLSESDIPAAPVKRDQRIKSDMLVNGGALKMALNVLRRAGKNEVADELEATAVSIKEDAFATPQPAESVKVPSEELTEFMSQFADGFDIPPYRFAEAARALLARYGQPVEPMPRDHARRIGGGGK